MSSAVIHWRLAEVMARHDVKGIELSRKLGLTPKAISHLRRSKTMPRIDGEALENLCVALTELAGKQITPFQLIDYEINDAARSA